MSNPYASIVIPTHDRDFTLAYSVRSALNQTVGNIEVIIAGDGCTSKVRELAKALEAEDSRVRFLDRPKAPLRGAANRDFAVRNARADRIFYNDDDDLLLPWHVEALGARLDQVDIVDTPPASVCPDGHLALGLHNSCHPLQREMLINERFKGVFDTHLAHRKSVYNAGSGAWMNADDHRVVLHMLKSFASAKDLRWVTINRITALSMHGARRVTMTKDQRARELELWTSKATAPGIENRLRETAGYCAHFHRLVMACKDEPQGGELLRTLGVSPGADRASAWERFRARFSPAKCRLAPRIRFTPEQRAALQGVATLIAGQRVSSPVACLVLDELMDPVMGPQSMLQGRVNWFVSVFGYEETSRLLEQLKPRPAVAVAKFHLALSQGHEPVTELSNFQEMFPDIPLESRFFLGLDVLRGLVTTQHPNAWECSERLAPLAPPSRHAAGFWELRKQLASALNRAADLEEATRRTEELNTSMV